MAGRAGQEAVAVEGLSQVAFSQAACVELVVPQLVVTRGTRSEEKETVKRWSALSD